MHPFSFANVPTLTATQVNTTAASSDNLFFVSDNIPVRVADNGKVNINVTDDMIHQIVDRMYKKGQRVIEPCRYCGSGNAITNPVCVQCGGDYPCKGK